MKFKYQSYDYSFLKPKISDPCYIHNAIRVAARAIGFDTTEVHTMDEPVGQLYWLDVVAQTNTTNDTTYEPIMDNGMRGGWEVTLTPPPAPIVEEGTIATTSTASTYVSNSNDNSTENMLNEWIRLHNEWRNRRMETVNNKKSISYWKKCNFLKNLRNKKYVKKV